MIDSSYSSSLCGSVHKTGAEGEDEKENTGQSGGRPRLLLTEGYNAVLAVNGGAQGFLRPFRPASPMTAALRRGLG
jgi:hypothetical protein